MTKEQKIEAFSMRLDGCTFKEIADKYGVSKQYIHSLFGGNSGKAWKTRDYEYPNLGKWMANTKTTIMELSEKIGITCNSLSMKLHKKREFRTSEIKSILKITGMTFEECFKEKEV